MLNRFILPVRRRIAVKLTLTLVGFVAVTTLVAGLYLRHALDQFAIEALESRLATAGRLLHDEARGLLVRRAGPEELARFTLPRASKYRLNRVGDANLVGGRAWTHPVIADGKLYVRDQELLFCYEIK